MENGKVENILRVQGIKCRGFGVFPKIVLSDPALSVHAKAIYGLFCSLAGKGDTAFPHRDTILRIMRMGRDTYYTALHELEGLGYIIIEKEACPNGSTQFTRNVYTIAAHPERYLDTAGLNNRTVEAYEKVMQFGLDTHGYGIVPYIVMSDRRIKSVDKAVYIYISVKAGAFGHADIDLRKMCADLGFKNVQRAQRHIKALKELGYITPVQLHVDGRFAGGRYYVNATPDMDVKHPRVECLTPAPKKVASKFVVEDAEIEEDDFVVDNGFDAAGEDDCSRAADQEVENRYTDENEENWCGRVNDEQHTENGYTGNSQKFENRYTAKEPPKNQNSENGYTDKESVINSNIYTNNNLNSMIDRLIPQVRKKIGYSLLKATYNSQDELDVLNDLVYAAAEAMCTPNQRIQIGGRALLASHVQEVLSRASADAAFQIIERFLCRQDKVAQENRKQYLLSSLYNEILMPTTPADEEDDF